MWTEMIDWTREIRRSTQGHPCRVMRCGIARGLALMTVIAGAGLGITACSSTPDTFDIDHIDPLTGRTRVRFEKGPDNTSLPPGWSVDGTRTIVIWIDGRRYTVTLCVARNLAFPNCVFVNSGGCGAQSGWTMYCEEAAQQSFASTDPTGTSPPCRSSGDIDYNPLTEMTDAVIVTGCSQLWVDEDLIDTFISHPLQPDQFLPSDTFRSIYGPTMPQNSTVHFAGDTDTAVWNAYMLKVNHFAFDADTGDRVAGAFASAGQDLPPLAVLTQNGVIAEIRFVYFPG